MYQKVDTKLDFADLLKYLLENTSTISFRISSLYPERVDESLCRIIKSDRIRPHFHLSVQSGSNKILKAMHRPYLAENVVRAVEMLRKAKNNPFIACDIIAGFPGETEEEFAKSLQFVQKCALAKIHVFPYSRRSGARSQSACPLNRTPAARSITTS